ncbi:MAG: nuclease-related domain-containing protein [Coriobacteriia bacterium]
MDYKQAKRRGDEGEQLVAAELARIAPLYGLTVLNGLLLQVGPMTAQLDHVVIDRFGVLIIESKVRNSAVLRGNDLQKHWTAVYPGGRAAKMQNPLAQNREHENAVRQALRDAGNPLDPDFVKSAVVIVGADLVRLELDSLARMRVVDIVDLEGLIRRRHDFALNSGAMDIVAIAAVAGTLRGLDRSRDSIAAAKHAAYRAPVAPQQKPVVDEDAVAQVLKSVARVSRRTHAKRYARGCVARIIALALLLAFIWWYFMGPGGKLLTDFVLPGPPQGSSTQAAPTATVEQAKAAVREASPETYVKIANVDTPVVTQVPHGTTFTWEYVEASGAAAQVKMIAVTLDASGRMVGVDMR